MNESDEFLNLDEEVFSDDAGSEDGGEEDVLTLKKSQKEEKKPKKGKKKKQDEEEEAGKHGDAEAEEDPELSGAMTKGWRKQDFYGGDDAGDASEADSDEELVLEEARRLEELRAKRLKGEVDPLAALLSHSKPEEKKEAKEEDEEQGAASGAGSGAGAQFETLFAAEAERGAVQRDLKQLPEAKRRGLLKSEAPELVPLLTDFRAKLQSLRKIVPLLAPQAHAHMKPTGVSYLKAKATLLLNTLANLSYYIVLRAEGGSVRSHPVISQLVWLRELHEMLAPLDERLDPALAKASKDWRKLRKLAAESEKVAESNSVAEPPAGPAKPRVEPAEPHKPAEPAKPISLRERFRLIQAAAKEKAAAEAKASLEAAAAKRPAERSQKGKASVSDLLRLPSKRRKDGGAADAPSDLEEVDPLIGGWQPTSTLAEQLLSVRQQLGERAAKTKAPSADLNVEAQPLKARQRMRESQEEVDATSGRHSKEDEEEDELISDKKAAAKAKKAKKEAAAEARKKALAAQQFKPEEVLEGRRATSQKILKNRGLVRQRKKTAGNARINNRQKYEKAVKRRKGAVQEMREGATDGTYAGEATGVRTHIKKSLKLG